MSKTHTGHLLLDSIPRTRGRAFMVGPFGGGIPSAKRMMRNCLSLKLRQEFLQRVWQVKLYTATWKCALFAVRDGCRYLLSGSALPIHQEGQKSHNPGAVKSLCRHASCGY